MIRKLLLDDSPESAYTETKVNKKIKQTTTPNMYIQCNQRQYPLSLTVLQEKPVKIKLRSQALYALGWAFQALTALGCRCLLTEV
jgi:hypothetical protein